MKRAAAALRTVLVSYIGLEGAFLAAGVACLAFFADSFIPTGHLLVVGLAFLLLGAVLAIPRRE